MLHKDTKKINNSKEITKKKCMEGRAPETHRLRSSPAGRKKSQKLSTNMPEHTVQLKGKNQKGNI